MRVKICGITNLADARVAVAARADFIGLIRAPSVRRVRRDAARIISASLPETTRPVLVFRDAPVDEVLGALRDIRCFWVQLHGSESPRYLRELTTLRGDVRIIRAWPVTGPQSADPLQAYLRDAARLRVRIDVVLLDAPKDAPHPGYECLARIARVLDPRPSQLWCAGGLRSENLVNAVPNGTYDGVDVASGVELRPGAKDHAALRRFVEIARGLGPPTPGPSSPPPA